MPNPAQIPNSMDESAFDGLDADELISPLSELPALQDTHNGNQPVENLHDWLSWCADDAQPSYHDTVDPCIDACVDFQASFELFQSTERRLANTESHQYPDDQFMPRLCAPGVSQERRERRRAQNRNAQKAYRDRKDQHVQELETKIKELEALTADLMIRNAQQGNVIEQLSASSSTPLKAVAITGPEKPGHDIPTCPSLSAADGIRPDTLLGLQESIMGQTL